MKNKEKIIEGWEENFRALAKQNDIDLLVGFVRTLVNFQVEKQRQEIVEEFDSILAEELLICYQRKQPTSRLSSLSTKFKQTLNK